MRCSLKELESVLFPSTGPCPTCPDCQSDWGMPPREFYAKYEKGEIYCEGRFSWSSCDWCGSSLGGDREPAHAIDSNGNLIHYDGVCFDCILAEANGEPYPNEE